MEIHGNFHPPLQQKWAGEGILFLGLEYYLSQYKVNTFIRGAKWVHLPYIWHQTQGSYVGQLDLLFLITYWAISENQIETIAKPIHQSIAMKLLKVLFTSA